MNISNQLESNNTAAAHQMTWQKKKRMEKINWSKLNGVKKSANLMTTMSALFLLILLMRVMINLITVKVQTK